MTRDEIEKATRPALIPMRMIPAIFGTSLNGAYQLAKTGELKTVRLGRRRFVTTDQVREKLGLPPVTSVESEAA